MKKLAIALALAGVALAGCSASTSSPAAPVAVTATPSPSTSLVPETHTTVPPKAALADGNWTVVSSVKPTTTFGLTQLKLRIRNDGSQGSSLVQLDFLVGGDVVTSCVGAANDVKAGATVTVDFLCDKVLTAKKYTLAFQAT